MRLATILFLVLPASATTYVWVRAGAPMAKNVLSCTNATPVFCTLDNVTGLVAGQHVVISGVAANNSGAFYISAANGERKIGAVVGSTVSLQDTTGTDGVADGAPIAGNGAWISGTYQGWAAGAATLGVLTKLALVDGPKGMFDGWNGPTTRRWATGLHNGLVSIIVTSNVATVTYSYAHGLNALDKIKLWNTANATFTPSGGREFTVASTPTATTYTFPVTIANGNYTSNPTCGTTSPPTINGTDECVRISAGATSTNNHWTTEIAREPTAASGNYRFAFQGVASPTEINWGTGPAIAAEFYALKYMLDRKDSVSALAAVDVLKNIGMMAGGNAYENPEANDLGHYELSEQASIQNYQAANAFQIVAELMTPTEQADFLQTMQGDVADVGSCTPAVAQRLAFNTGTSRAGTSTTIQLATTASAVDGAYVNAVVDVLESDGNRVVGLVTAYTGATQTATVVDWRYSAGGLAIDPAAGQAYNVWETSSVSGTTMTGYGSHWNTAGADQVHVGDYMISQNLWLGMQFVGRIGYYVTAVNSDTNLTVIPGQSGHATGTTTPQVSWLGHKRSSPSTDCGFMRIQRASPAAFGAQPIQYQVHGGTGTNGLLGNNIGGNIVDFNLHWQLSLADFDTARATRNIARESVAGMDFQNLLNMSYMGMFYSGTLYGPGRATQGAYGIADAFTKSIVGFPNLDLTGKWIKDFQIWKYMALDGSVCAYPQTGDSFAASCPAEDMMTLDYGNIFDRTTLASRHARYLNDVTLGHATGIVGLLSQQAVLTDPRSLALSYTSEPTQYMFGGASGTSRAAALTFGWNKSVDWRGDAVISRSSHADPCATLVWMAGQAYIADHNNHARPADFQLSKCGAFEGNDQLPNGYSPAGTPSGPYLQFGGSTSLKGSYDTDGPATSDITRWAGTTATGDPASHYVYTMMDVSGSYTTASNRATEEFVHLKGVGEEIIITRTDVNLAVPASSIMKPTFLTQNGEALWQNYYPEGTTTYPGGGCGALNANRRVLIQQDGGTSAPIHGAQEVVPLPGVASPQRKYNEIVAFTSPGSITVNCDGTSYPGATGHAERVSVYAGAGGAATVLDYAIVRKIATQPDTTLTLTALNADANWLGINTPSAAVFLARGGSGTGRGGATHPTIEGEVVSLTSPGQVLIGGLDPGAYWLTVGPYDCGTITVDAGSKAAYCETSGAIVSGAITLTAVGGGGGTVYNPPLVGGAKPAGGVVVH